MYGRIRCCDDFSFLLFKIFVSFLEIFLGDFRSSILRVFSSDFFERIMGECIMPLCG
jgi:hypothetical protein